MTTWGSVKRATEADVEDAVDELLEQAQASIPVAPGRKPSFKGWMDHYLDKVAPRRCDPDTIRDYRSLLTNYAYPVAGKARVDRFTTTHMDEIYERMDDAGRPPSTQVKMRSIISRGLRIAQVRYCSYRFCVVQFAGYTLLYTLGGFWNAERASLNRWVTGSDQPFRGGAA